MKNKTTTKSQVEFLKDHKNIGRLEAIPTGEFAFEEIAGDPNKKIIYYEKWSTNNERRPW